METSPGVNANALVEFKATCVARSADIGTGRGSDESDNFPQGCALSPDGLCVLTATTSDNLLRLYNTPPSSHEDDTPNRSTPTIVPLKTALLAQCGDSIRSYAWYPKMNSADPGSCAFLATSRDQPIHLIDAYTSNIRASYRPYNALDEMESPAVVQFSPDGNRIFATGFKTDRTIHVFHTAIPGRESDILRLGNTRRSNDGQKGIVSALSFPKSAWGGKHVFAVGTYSPGSIYIYDDRMSKGGHNMAGTVLNGLSIVGHGRNYAKKKRRFTEVEHSNQTNKETFHQIDEIGTGTVSSTNLAAWYQSRARGGIMQLEFSTGDEYTLYSSSRRSDAVLAWDIRMLSHNPEYMSVPVRGIGAFSRNGDSNQRLEFDIDDSGSRLFAGSHDGGVKVFDLSTGKPVGHIPSPSTEFTTANGISYQPSSTQRKGGLLVAAFGSRSFPQNYDSDDASEAAGDSSSIDTIIQEIETKGGLAFYNIEN